MGGGNKKELLGTAALVGLGIATGGFGLAAAPALAGAAGAGAAGAGAAGAGAGAAGATGAAVSPMAAGVMGPAVATPFVTGAPGAATGMGGGTAALFGPEAGAGLSQITAPAAMSMGAPPAVSGMQRFGAAMDKLAPAMKMMNASQGQQQKGPPSPQQTNQPPQGAPTYGQIVPRRSPGLFGETPGGGKLEQQRLAMLRKMGVI